MGIYLKLRTNILEEINPNRRQRSEAKVFKDRFRLLPGLEGRRTGFDRNPVLRERRGFVPDGEKAGR